MMLHLLAQVRIQKVWRGHMTRKMVRRKREEELIFIGMVSCASRVKSFFLLLFVLSSFHFYICTSTAAPASL